MQRRVGRARGGRAHGVGCLAPITPLPLPSSGRSQTLQLHSSTPPTRIRICTHVRACMQSTQPPPPLRPAHTRTRSTARPATTRPRRRRGAPPPPSPVGGSPGCRRASCAGCWARAPTWGAQGRGARGGGVRATPDSQRQTDGQSAHHPSLGNPALAIHPHHMHTHTNTHTHATIALRPLTTQNLRS